MQNMGNHRSAKDYRKYHNPKAQRLASRRGQLRCNRFTLDNRKFRDAKSRDRVGQRGNHQRDGQQAKLVVVDDRASTVI